MTLDGRYTGVTPGTLPYNSKAAYAGLVGPRDQVGHLVKNKLTCKDGRHQGGEKKN